MKKTEFTEAAVKSKPYFKAALLFSAMVVSVPYLLYSTGFPALTTFKALNGSSTVSSMDSAVISHGVESNVSESMRSVDPGFTAKNAASNGSDSSANPITLSASANHPVPANTVQTAEENKELWSILERAATADKTVILTYLNQAWAAPNSVFDLLLESMRIGNGTKRLIKHMVVVSLDDKAHSRCLSLSLNCYFLQLKGFNYSTQAFYMSPKYKEMMWRRLDFLHTVLSLGYNFLFSDADIMWFRDPFPHLLDDADFQIACDHFNGNSSDVRNFPNAGFKYVRSNEHTILFYKLWYDSRHLYEGKNEQEVFNIIKIGPLFDIIGLKVKFLDTTFFGGFCEASKDIKQVCTVHANCCVSLRGKINDLKLIINDWRKYSSLSASEEPPHPFEWSAPKLC